MAEAPALKRLTRTARLSAAAVLFAAWPLSGALALSEIQREELPPPPATTEPAAPATPGVAPPVDPAAPVVEPPAASEEAEPPLPELQDVERATPPAVEYDLSKLPEPVRRMHDNLVEACKSGDVEKLRALLDTGENATLLSVSPVEGDPIAFLRSSSGDGEGVEICAIMLDVLSAGYVHTDPGGPEELYVWPYFFAVPLDTLDNRQKVELFRILTAGDFEEMKSVGSYVFYRAGITPEGRWAFFLAGD